MQFVMPAPVTSTIDRQHGDDFMRLEVKMMDAAQQDSG